MAAFPDTQWSLLRRSGQSPSARVAAFSRLARDYRPAILAFFRARLPASDADDAAQGFLALSFEHQWWARAEAANGSFRSFLLMLLHRHAARVRNLQGRQTAPLDVADGLEDPAPGADRQFDTRFALLLTQRALEHLRQGYTERGRGALFESLTRLLVVPAAHGELVTAAASLGLAPNTLSVELKRLRARLHEALRAELRELCADEVAFDAEWASLKAVLEGR